MLGFFNVRSRSQNACETFIFSRWTSILCLYFLCIYFSVDASMGYYENEQACNVSIKCNSLSPITNCINGISGSQTNVRAECTGTFSGMMKVDFKIAGRRFTSTASKIIHKTISCLSGINWICFVSWFIQQVSPWVNHKILLKKNVMEIFCNIIYFKKFEFL